MNGQASHASRAATRPGGFTLIELMVVITIIAILATAVLGAMFSARQLACEAKTKSIITRLDQIISRRYESYRTRRIPLDVSRIVILPNERASMKIARARLDALRDLMRMEMPDRWYDVREDPNVGNHVPLTLVGRPALSGYYLAAYEKALYYLQNELDPPLSLDKARKRIRTHGPAELLYLIVATGPSEDRAQFQESEIGDADEDTLLEFHDAWGKPIYFLRWAPGFNVSEVQPNIDVTWDDTAKQLAQQIAKDDHDPFDTRKLDLADEDNSGLPTDTNGPVRGWRLVPLIYSGGPDERRAIEVGDNPNGEDYYYQNNPWAYSDIWGFVGQPADDSGAHLDNIHNHMMEQR